MTITNQRALAKALAATGMACTALLSSAAMAQTSDNATVDAVATLQQVTPPLTVTAVNQLDFGTVNIPNGTVARNSCSYDVRAGGIAPIIVRELDSSGSLVDATFPTPSNCEQTGTYQPARFAISCSPATPTSLNVVLTVAAIGSNEGLFLPSETTQIAALQQDATNNGFINTNSDFLVATCPDGSASGSTPAAFDVLVGGRLILFGGATPGSDIIVGTITLEAFY